MQLSFGHLVKAKNSGISISWKFNDHFCLGWLRTYLESFMPMGKKNYPK